MALDQLCAALEQVHAQIATLPDHIGEHLKQNSARLSWNLFATRMMTSRLSKHGER